jgi:trigger factor
MQTLVLGSNTFIPGFEDQLIGYMPGDEVSVKVMFPSEYHAPDLAGKAAEFKCKIHQIRVKTPYELDDTFAKEVGGCETFAEMHKKLGESMQGYSDERGEMDLQDRLLRQAAETLEFTPSQKQIEDEVENQMQNLTAQLAQQGLNLEMYCQFLSTDEEALRSEFRASAESTVKLEAAIEEIVSIENLEATEAEIDEAVDVVARQNRMTVEELKPYFNAEFKQAIIRSILSGKVMSLIRENATVTVTEN